jgi:hypothetical protein
LNKEIQIRVKKVEKKHQRKRSIEIEKEKRTKVGGFLRELWFPPPIQLTDMIL